MEVKRLAVRVKNPGHKLSSICFIMKNERSEE